MATYPTVGSGQEVAATKGGKKDGALKGRRYDRKFEERAQRCWSYRKNGSEDPPLQSRPSRKHGIRRLALPDVLSARAGNRLGGIFLGHRLPANGTIFAPHLGTTFPSLTCGNAGRQVVLTEHCVEFFELLQDCEKRQRLPVGGYRPG